MEDSTTHSLLTVERYHRDPLDRNMERERQQGTEGDRCSQGAVRQRETVGDRGGPRETTVIKELQSQCDCSGTT